MIEAFPAAQMAAETDFRVLVIDQLAQLAGSIELMTPPLAHLDRVASEGVLLGAMPMVRLAGDIPGSACCS